MSDWPALVESSLLAIPSVTEVRVEVDRSNLSDFSLDEPLIDDDNERGYFWPEPPFGALWFDVTIPKRMQPELLGESGDVGAESFRVRTDYGWHGPCTFVSCLDGDEATEPEKAVRLVHAFIKQELERSNSLIRIARVGPSPFHMTGSIAEGDGPSEPLTFKVVEIVGYHSYEFEYLATAFDDIDDAETALQYAIAPDLQLFYDLARRQSRREMEAFRLSVVAVELARRHTATGLASWFHRVFRSGTSARRLALEAMQARLVSAQDAEYARTSIQSNIDNTDVLNAFTNFLVEESHDSTRTEIDTAVEVARLVEGARSSDYEVAVIAGATLLGGLVGGLAGAVITAGG